MATTSRFRVNKKEVTPPIEAIPKAGEQGLLIEASFGNDNIQPAITPLDFTFTNDAAKELRDMIDNGDIFKNAEFEVELIGQAGIVEIINGYLDLTKQFEEISPVQVKTTAKLKESTLTLDDKINSFTLDLLKVKGVITDADIVNIPYVVEKFENPVDIAILSVTIFLMIKELAESIEKLSADVSVFLGLTSSSATGGIGALVYQISVVLVRLAYTTIMLKTVVDLITDLISRFISEVRLQKGLNSGNILAKGFGFLGYEFESDIPELEFYNYCPSIFSEGDVTGLPNASDYGYSFGEFLDIFRTVFNAKIAVIDGVVQFRSENSTYWDKDSTYIMEDVLLEDLYSKRYNTDKVVGSKIYEYALDSRDAWTYDNYLGTNYAVNLEHTSVVNKEISGIEGFERISFPVALGNRKDELNELEEVLLVLAKIADTVANFLGGSNDFSGQLKKRIGMLKISERETTVPKLLYMVGESLPANHRSLTKVKYLYDKYLNETSFVLNDFKRQRILYSGVEIGFGLNDYLETAKNSYFTTAFGEKGKFIKLVWDVENDRALVDFWIKNPNPSKKIKETYIETN